MGSLDQQNPSQLHLNILIMQAFIVALSLASVAFADHAPAYGHHAPAYGPQIHCRDTNTSVYAEVCVPAFTTKTTPITLDVKVVKDNDYCYDQIRTNCIVTETVNQHELCTYTYGPKKDTLPARITQVTYEDKSETMKVTSCKPSGYGDHYGAGEHQYCREEYQTQAYKVPLVDAPLDITVELTNPEPIKECVTKDIILTEVVCEDIVEQKCFNVAELVDNVNVVDQVEIILGEPNCNAVTLTLPTKACKKSHY